MNGAKVFIGLAVAILLVAFAFQQKIFTFRFEVSNGQEKHYSLGLEQPFMGGKVILDEIWLVNNKPEFLRISGRFIGFDPKDHFYVSSRVREEPDGSENGVKSWYRRMESTSNPDEVPFHFEYMVPPTAAKKLYVRIYLEEKSMVGAAHKLVALADFSFFNPLRRKPQQWNAEPIPVVRKDAPLEVQLTRLETGLAGPLILHSNGLVKLSSKRGESGFHESFSRLNLRVLEDGNPTPHWRPMWYSLSAASGVTVEAAQGNGTENTEAIFEGTLWKSEGPWKVHVTLMRTNDFRHDEIIEIKDVSVPWDGQVTKGDQQWSVGEYKLQFLGVAGGQVEIPEWNLFRKENRPSVHFKLSGPKTAWLKLISISDKLGNVIWTPVEDYATSYRHIPNNPFFFVLERDGKDLGGKEINIKCAVVWEQREVDFIAEPTYSGQSYNPKLE